MADLRAVLHVFLIFMRLGITSFGGPVAHLSYFREAFVVRRRWLDEEAYAGLVAFCQFLPGPASSQVAMGLGLERAGHAGLLAAFVGFTLPSAILMVLFALVLDAGMANAPWVHGLKIATVAIVAQALWAMAQRLTPDLPRLAFALAAAVIVMLAPGELGQVAAILLAGLLGWMLLKPVAEAQQTVWQASSRLSWVALATFFLLLAVLPFVAPLGHAAALFDAIYRAGALVFGGGHVILPLLQQAVVTPGWISNAQFLVGYGAAQAMPGPLFSFAAFLGAAMGGWAMALLCLAAIYLPSLLLVAGGWPLWRAVAHHAQLRAALAGTNAAVVGLVAAALYSSAWVGAIFSPADIGIALVALLLLLARAPSWLVVAFGAGAASLVALWLH